MGCVGTHARCAGMLSAVLSATGAGTGVEGMAVLEGVVSVADGLPPPKTICRHDGTTATVMELAINSRNSTSNILRALVRVRCMR